MELTEHHWELAKQDASELEAKIAILVDEFEQKHKPIQCNVLTRGRNYKHLYDCERGGAAQTILHQVSNSEGIWTTDDAAIINQIDIIRYSNKHLLLEDVILPDYGTVIPRQ